MSKKDVVYRDASEDLAKLTPERLVRSGQAWQPESPEEIVYRNELRELVLQALKTLTPREQEVIRMRFGLLEDGEEKTLIEVAAHFFITRERVRQIENKALRKLRHPSRSRNLKAALFPSRT